MASLLAYTILVRSIVLQTVPTFAQCRGAIRAIIELVPANQYYKVSWLAEKKKKGKEKGGFSSKINIVNLNLVERYMDLCTAKNSIRSCSHFLPCYRSIDQEGTSRSSFRQ